jgi:hypothetical protein
MPRKTKFGRQMHLPIILADGGITVVCLINGASECIKSAQDYCMDKRTARKSSDASANTLVLL